MNRLIFTFLILCSTPAFAFMNIESIRQNAKQGTSGSVGAKVDGQSGNSNKLASEFTTLTMVRADLNEYLAAGKYRYGESRHVKDTHEGNAHLRYARGFSAWSAGESFYQIEFNEFKKLKRRDLIGGGLRTVLSRQDANVLYLGTGLFYEHEDFEDVTDEQTVRGNLYLSFVRSFNSHVSGTLIAYYQPSLNGFGDTRAQVDSGLQVKLVERLALTVEFDLQHDSQPAPGVKQTDTSYMMGLAYAY